MSTDTRKMTSPRTQTTYTVGRSTLGNILPWTTTCDTHGTALPRRTRSTAREAVEDPTVWCKGCAPAPTPSPKRSHGGRRPGAGRKPVTDAQVEHRRTDLPLGSGGYRPGAGRKPSLGSGDRVQVVTREEQISNEKRPARSFTILTQHSEMIDAWADARCNGNASAALREMLKTASSQIGAGS